MLGQKLEDAGWRQGSVVGKKLLGALFAAISKKNSDDALAIVASQSCDIANNNLDLDPYLEISICRPIDKVHGEYSYNKNPRKLHLTLSQRTENEAVISYQNVELKAYEKVQIPKELFDKKSPEKSLVLESKMLTGYVAWLAARYSRPALPTAFNDRIRKADPKRKFKKKAKSVNKSLSGIYVEIIPDKEIPDDEVYRVNLLGLAAPEAKGNEDELRKSLESFVDIMKVANMDVHLSINFEDEISIELIKRFKRFYYDDLSFKSDEILPPEVTHNI